MPELRGLRPPLAPDPFESLVTSITAQQVSLHAAFAIRGRFIERFGVRAGRVWAFPTRERVAVAEERELVELGFSRRKAEYAVGLARADIDLDALAALPDEEVKAQLVALRGIGEWTAEWFLARHLARPRAWPVGDIGLRKAVAHFYGDSDERVARPRFEPFENLSAHYLLAALYWRRLVNIRTATSEDVDLLMSLVERLESELPALPYAEDPAEFERRKVERMVSDGIALIAEEDGNAVGYALARYGDHGPTTVYVSDLWVDSPARGEESRAS